MADIGFPLYHGTSTLFLEGIAKHGLGGHDPVKALRVVECARKLLPLAEANKERSAIIERRLASFPLMAEQVGGRHNFQHGQAYLSPSSDCAIGYACRKSRGSEIISYTLDIADELMRLDVEVVLDEIAHEFADLFDLIDVSSAPVLIKVGSVDESALLSEAGEAPGPNLEFVRAHRVKDVFDYEQVCSQQNFRLSAPVPAGRLSAWLILTQRREFVPRDFTLLPVALDKPSKWVPLTLPVSTK